jgi:hypothetical protein
MEKLTLFLKVIAYMIIVWNIIHVILVTRHNRQVTKLSYLIGERTQDTSLMGLVLAVLSIVFLIIF